MALADLQAFIQERLQIFDPTIDVTSGSPADTQVVQPILDRLGGDPFTVDFITFAQDRLTQEFPDLAIKEGDALTDLLIKTAMVLFDPIVRENTRIAKAQSFKDPTSLTLDEADALGANLFATRDLGDYALGQGRIYFAQAQQVSLSPANFFSSKSGLHFFPTGVQSITADEMLFNVEGTLYYFDVNLQAEQPGDEYNIEADNLASVANVTSAVRVTNKRRFRFGNPQETAVDFIGRAEQDLSERSLVTTRGVTSQITKAFPEVTQVATVGFGDPQMNRDVIKGGGLGKISASGFALHPVPDLENRQYTRRITIDITEPVNFIDLIGPPGPVSGWTLTIHGGVSSVPLIRDLHVRAVIDARTLDLVEQVVVYNALASLTWVLRQNAITLSDIPGGILFPDSPDGTVSVPDDEIHIGGTTDMFIRAIDFDSASLLLDDVVDDKPLFSGVLLTIIDTNGHVNLGDYIFGVDFAANDDTFNAFVQVYYKQQTLEIVNGAAAGSYRVIGIDFNVGQPVQFTLDPAPSNPPGDFIWRILETLTIDLSEPKETKISGDDLETVQGTDTITTASGADFQTYGVGQGDVFRILNGPDAADYTVQQVLTPFFTRIQLDRSLKSTGANLKYTIFRRNKSGGILLPLVRLDSIDILDSSGQPTGSTLPYALPIDGRSSSFANVAHGIKEDVTDAQLGIVSPKLGSGANVSGLVLHILRNGGTSSITFTGSNPLTAQQLADQINNFFGERVAVVFDTDRFGILPLSVDMAVVPVSGDAGNVIWGNLERQTTYDIRSVEVSNSPGGWNKLTPVIDVDYDVVQVLDGFQIGYYDGLVPADIDGFGNATTLLAGSSTLQSKQFAPEVGRHIQVGSRSLGTVRLYFLDPTSASFDKNALFSTTLSNGTVLNYLPDKTQTYQIVPALPNDAVPKDGSATATGTLFTSASSNFFQAGVLPGDRLKVTYQPFQGTVALADPVTSLVFTTLILSLGGGPDQTIVFVNDSGSIPSTAVSRAGVVTQVNNAAGQTICSLDGSNHLVFEADISIVLRSTGTANTLLGFLTSSDTHNDAADQGTYTIFDLTATTLSVDHSFVSTASNQHFLIFRPGFQRIVSTQMAKQQEVAGLYYCDIQLISQGTGDIYNIAAGQLMTAKGFASDGYWLTTEDPDLTFSTIEKPVLHVSKTILEVGVSDNPVNATQISGQNLLLNYERSSLTSNVQNFVSADEERVICESPLARHLIPYFVRFDTNYVGGSQESVVLTDIETFIKDLAPNQSFQVSDLESLIKNRGALSIQNPIDLIAVIHNFDRTITVERSQDKLNTGTLAAFVPDVIKLTRLLSG